MKKEGYLDKGIFKMMACVKNQSGRSMIEMLGVLAIVGILSAGGITGYSMAMQSYKTDALIGKIQLINQQARIYYEQDKLDDFDANHLIDMGVIHDYNNPFGGQLDIEGADETLTFTIDGLPAETCVRLITSDWGYGKGEASDAVTGCSSSSGDVQCVFTIKSGECVANVASGGGGSGGEEPAP